LHYSGVRVGARDDALSKFSESEQQKDSDRRQCGSVSSPRLPRCSSVAAECSSWA